jgi:hypothetical protein
MKPPLKMCENAGSGLQGLLPKAHSAYVRVRVREAFRGLEKTRSSLLKHIFSTIPAFTPPSTKNWVSKRSDCPGVDVEKI